MNMAPIWMNTTAMMIAAGNAASVCKFSATRMTYFIRFGRRERRDRPWVQVEGSNL